MFKRLAYRLIAVAFIVFVFTTSALFFPIALLIWLFTAAIDKRLRLLHQFTCFWASLYVWIFPPWRVSNEGKQHLDPKQTYIIVSNHQSLVDILVAFTLFIHFKWVSKAELFNIPLIGWNMYLNKYIRLKRGKKNSIRRMYRACERHLKQGSSVYLFPEGTRSPSGMVRPFKEGAFVLSKRLNLPILPVVINGSKNALPKNSLNFHGDTDVHVEILPPIWPNAEQEAKDYADEVRELIRSKVAEEQAAAETA